MRLLRWILNEALYRKTSTALIFFAVALASCAAAAGVLLLRSYDASIEAFVSEKEAALEKQMKRMWNEYRKITKGLGFNVLILPENQNLADFYADNFASEYMPEEYAQRLAQSKTITVQHILPTLVHKTTWPERKRTVLVFGVRGELSRMHFPEAQKKSPILEVVDPGAIVLGFELWKGLNIEVGDTVAFRGKTFAVSKCYPRRGNRDDITLWMNLGEAQAMFYKRDSINAILALECRCTAAKNLANIANIRNDLQKILPQTQVVEFMSKAIARAEARYQATAVSRESIEAEKQRRIQLRETRAHYALWTAGVLATGCMLCIMFLFFGNFNRRRTEASMFRALGIPSSQIALVLFGKAALIGVIGAAAGSAASLGVSRALQNIAFDQSFHAAVSFSPGLLAAILTGGVFFCVLGGLFPAITVLRTDPAVILQEE